MKSYLNIVLEPFYGNVFSDIKNWEIHVGKETWIGWEMLTAKIVFEIPWYALALIVTYSMIFMNYNWLY